MASIDLYVNSTDSAGSWDVIGASPYINTQNEPTAYIEDNDRNNDSDTFGFETSSDLGTITSVTLYLYAYGAAIDNFEAILSGSGTGLGPPASSWDWVSTDVSGILDSWAAINSATLLFDRPNTQDLAGVDCAYLHVEYEEYTGPSGPILAYHYEHH